MANRSTSLPTSDMQNPGEHLWPNDNTPKIDSSFYRSYIEPSHADSITFLGPLGQRPEEQQMTAIADKKIDRSVRMDAGTIRESQTPDWIGIVLLASFVILAWAKFNFGRRLRQIVSACMSPRYLGQLLREGSVFNEQVTLGLGFIYISSLSLLILYMLYTLELINTVEIPGLALYAGVFAFILIYWGFTSVANRLLAFIFETYEAAQNFALNTLLFNLTTGLGLILLLPFVIYSGSNVLLWATFAWVAAMIVYRVMRGVLIGAGQTRFPWYYLLAFIFFIEILPFLLIAKAVMIYMDIQGLPFVE